MINIKNGSAWIWGIVFLILIGVGIGIYFWVTKGDVPPMDNIPISSLAQPPAFPN